MDGARPQRSLPTDREPAPSPRRWRPGLWWTTGLGLGAGALVGARLAPDSGPAEAIRVLLILWAIVSAFVLLWRGWRRLTYRIGVRLFLSYLLVDTLPFALLAVLVGAGGYVLVGQYASSRFGDLLDRVQERLQAAVTESVAAPDMEQARQALTRVAGGITRVPRVEWLLSREGTTAHSPGAAELSLPRWAADGVETGTFLAPPTTYLGVVARRGDRLAAALVPLDDSAAEAITRESWFEVEFVPGQAMETGPNLQIRTHPAAGTSPPEPVVATELGDQSRGLWARRWIVFFRLSTELRRWSDGGKIPEETLVTLITTSPAEAAGDLFRSPWELGRRFYTLFLFVASVLLAIYLAAVAVAVAQILSVIRSTARLTRGTRRVEGGDLAFRIPVKRRDQLGDLAASFNRMAASLQETLAQVAEKERMARELELAREIQRSLLPADRLEHGPLSVRAYFRPAAAVGGDYFDLFPVEPERLVVAVGDVAGHGLATGLLMAVVKSAVATLIREGRRGRDLLERLNHFMVDQPSDHRMVTLTVAELDAGAALATITSAGSPPPFLITPQGTVEEVLLSGLPVGFEWPAPPESRSLALTPGSRLVLYSDGLVEAADGDGEPRGYERLARYLRSVADLPSGDLLRALLEELERHTGGGGALEDDLTVLVVEHRPDPDAG